MKVTLSIWSIVLLFLLNVACVKDVEMHSDWFEKEINKAIEKDVIETLENIDYREMLTQSQMEGLFVAFAKQMELSIEDIEFIENPTRRLFLQELYRVIEKRISSPDKNKGSIEYTHYFLTREIVQGYGNGKLGLDEKITYEQAISIILRTIDALSSLEMMYENGYLSFKDKTYIDLGYASSSINTSRFRQSALLDTGKGQFIAYFDKNGEATIQLIKPDMQAQIMKIYPNLSPSLLGNGHCSINMGYYQDKLFIFYGAHAISSHFAVIPIEKFGQVISVEAQKIDMLITYPQFYTIQDKLFLFFRKDTNPFDRINEKYNDICFLEITGATLELDKIKTLLKSEHYNSVYINELGIDSETIAIPYVYRLENDGSNRVKNEGFYVIKSVDAGKTYQNLNGQDFDLPIGFDSANRMLNIDENSNLMNQDGAYLTDDHYLFFTAIYDDEKGIPQIHLTSVGLDTNTIINRPVTQSTIDYELSGAGTIVAPISRSIVVASEKYIHIVYRMNNQMEIASTKRTSDGNWEDEWKILTPTTAILGAWEPIYDKNLWKEKKTLDVFIQATNQGKQDKAIDLEVTDIYVFRFMEKE